MKIVKLIFMPGVARPQHPARTAAKVTEVFSRTCQIFPAKKVR